MLSVVIASRDAVRDIGACLIALEQQLDAGVEVLVADASGDGTAELIERSHPRVGLVRREPPFGIGGLRAAGLAASRGDIVAFTDPYCRVQPGWIERLRREPWDGYAAVGGVVDPAPRRRQAEWAAFLNEYAPHLPPQPAGEASILPGNNVAFRRDVLQQAGLIEGREFWKTFALWKLSEIGQRFWVDPLLVVRHARATTTMGFAYQRYLNGRCFGATRVDRLGWRHRLARAGTCPALPILFTVRLIRAVHGRRQYRRALWQSLPFNLIFHAAWAVGELDGYVRGGGNACIQLA